MNGACFSTPKVSVSPSLKDGYKAPPRPVRNVKKKIGELGWLAPLLISGFQVRAPHWGCSLLKKKKKSLK